MQQHFYGGESHKILRAHYGVPKASFFLREGSAQAGLWKMTLGTYFLTVASSASDKRAPCIVTLPKATSGHDYEEASASFWGHHSSAAVYVHASSAVQKLDWGLG